MDINASPMLSLPYVKLETWLPYPVAKTLQGFRNIHESRHFERLDALTKVAEVLVKLLAAIGAKAYLLEGGEDNRFREAVQRIEKMALGHWAGLLRLSLAPYKDKSRAGPIEQLYNYYNLTWNKNNDVRDAINKLYENSQGAIKRPDGKLTTGAILDVLVNLRNFVAHGAKLSDEEVNSLLPPVEVVMQSILTSLGFFQDYHLFFVDVVKVDKNKRETQFIHEGRICGGRDIELFELKGTDALHDKRLYLVRYDEDMVFKYAIDLSPFWFIQSCPECYRLETFVLNGIKGKRINYLSYQCGHRLELQDLGGEITDLLDFIQGKLSLESLFEGRVLGSDAARVLSGPSLQERRRAQSLTSDALYQIEMGLPSDALPLLDQALRMNQDDARAHYLRGVAMLAAERSVYVGVQNLKEAVRLNPDHHTAHYLLSLILFEFKSYTECAAHIESAISKDPANGSYRELEKAIPDLEPGVPEADIEYDADAQLRRKLAELAQSTVAKQRTADIKLYNWTVGLPPFSWIRRSPFLGSAIVAFTVFLIILVLQTGHLTASIFFQQLSIAWNNWLLLYASFLGVYATANLYNKLRPVITVPEDAFRRFFIRQCRIMLGETCLVNDRHVKLGILDVLKLNRIHALIALVFFLVCLPLQYFCANDQFFLNVATVSRYFSYVFQAYCLSWTAPLCLFCLRFIPEFSNLPQRYFPDMPDSVSLRPLGQLYVYYGLIVAMVMPGFLFQHYVFRTVINAPITHWAYFTVVILLSSCIFLISQLILKHTLLRLKDRRITQFSYKLETSFEDFIRDPKKEKFNELTETRMYMQELSKLQTTSMARRDLLTLMFATVLIGTFFLVYLFLVNRGFWLV